MIKIEHVVLASPEQMEFIIEGMRNPHNSWEKSDSKKGGYYIRREYGEPCSWYRIDDPNEDDLNDDCVEWVDDESSYEIGPNDHDLMQRLANAGTDHRKFMRMMPVYVRITAPFYLWKEFSTYKVGTVANSCSTMHKIAEKEFTLEDFSTEHLISGSMRLMKVTIDALNEYREWYLKYDSMREEDKVHFDEGITCKKDIWWQMIQLLPSSYNQTRNVMLNYEVLANIYKSRKNHRLDEWRELCSWIKTLPYSELITGDISRGMRSTAKIIDETCDNLDNEKFRSMIDKAIENYGSTDGIEDIIDKICAIGNPNPLSAEDIKKLMTEEH